MHERRAEVIAELYSRLADMLRTAVEAVSLFEYSTEPSKQERYKAFAETYNQFFLFYDRNSIFLTAKTCKKIDNIKKAIIEPLTRFKVFVVDDEKRGTLDKDAYGAWVEASRSVSETKIPEARKALETELRQIIGSDK